MGQRSYAYRWHPDHPFQGRGLGVEEPWAGFGTLVVRESRWRPVRTPCPGCPGWQVRQSIVLRHAFPFDQPPGTLRDHLARWVIVPGQLWVDEVRTAITYCPRCCPGYPEAMVKAAFDNLPMRLGRIVAQHGWWGDVEPEARFLVPRLPPSDDLLAPVLAALSDLGGRASTAQLCDWVVDHAFSSGAFRSLRRADRAEVIGHQLPRTLTILKDRRQVKDLRTERFALTWRGRWAARRSSGPGARS